MRRCKKMKQKKFKFSGDLLTFILVAAVYAVVAYLPVSYTHLTLPTTVLV